MTDAEIIKALECCQTEYERKCKQGCPYMQFQKKYISADTCSSRLRADLLDLINRQKAEIEMLTEDTIPKLQYSLKRANKYGIETDKENERLKAEVERLEHIVSIKQKNKQTTKVEAIKDFAVMLKSRFMYDKIINDAIDNLVKEMVGADE